MRSLAIAVLTLLLATPALAAPTCQDRLGQTVRCDVPSAMPVGWTASPAQRAALQSTRPPEPSANEMLELILALVALFGVIALLPEFDGSHDADWDPERQRRP